MRQSRLIRGGRRRAPDARQRTVRPSDDLVEPLLGTRPLRRPLQGAGT